MYPITLLCILLFLFIFHFPPIIIVTNQQTDIAMYWFVIVANNNQNSLVRIQSSYHHMQYPVPVWYGGVYVAFMSNWMQCTRPELVHCLPAEWGPVHRIQSPRLISQFGQFNMLL